MVFDSFPGTERKKICTNMMRKQQYDLGYPTSFAVAGHREADFNRRKESTWMLIQQPSSAESKTHFM